ncbi:MAG: GGDEF domain-containing protein [Bacilli bacterium]|nr:GGDEF domain-containing protein [Bacilli bacterium]
MKIKTRFIIAGILGVIVAALVGVLIYRNINSANSLSNIEKKWLDTNSSKVLSITIPNDIPVFGSTGAGVFFDFVDYLSDDLNLKINKNTVSYVSESTGYGFEVSDKYNKDKLLLFKDHFVLVSKNTGLLYDTDNIPNLKVGVNSSSLNLVKDYYGVSEDKFASYSTYAEITQALSNGNLTYALVPLNEYKDELISNNINILAHISDLNHFYYFRLDNDETINSIFTKEFNKWKDKQYEDSYNKNNFKLFIDKLNISEAEERNLTNKTYLYGFTENRPYEILASSEYGGITAEYLRSFSKFSGVDFTYKKYKNASKLAEAAINGDIDLYYNYYNIITNYIDSGALGRIDYEVIVHNSIDLSLSNINGLAYHTVYVLKDSYLYDMIKDLPGIDIQTYASPADLKKIVSKKAIIVLDSNTAKYYLNKLTNDYTARYSDTYELAEYTFRYKNSTDIFYKLFNAYTKTIDPSDLIRFGITTYNNVEYRGDVFGTIARYSLVIIVVASVTIFIYTKNKKTIKLDTKIKKVDRIKYIDLLTSLKNRNYYNDRLSVWNKNKIYPQACIVLDINNVKFLNDSMGHEEGDRQICSVANVLIKTQIDNTEIMRTDGNEFLVYMVGYSEKQILSYIKRLIKGFNKLPHDSGVAIGFSIIEDDTKLVEDAYNEALIKMRENKEKAYEESEK